MLGQSIVCRTFINVIRRLPFYPMLRNLRARGILDREFRDWVRNGKPAPPPHLLKQQVLRETGLRYGLRFLVESGTYRGDMLEALKRDFDRLYSIELSPELHAKAKKRFKPDKNIELILGDSGRELAQILRRIDRAALFWLDGHYSAGVTARGARDTPIYEELEHILGAPDLGHVVIIDDARCFGRDSGYPTIDELKKFVLSRRPGARISVENDSIRIKPKERPAHDLSRRVR
jgi:hypothetical protein